MDCHEIWQILVVREDGSVSVFGEQIFNRLIKSLVNAVWPQDLQHWLKFVFRITFTINIHAMSN